MYTDSHRLDQLETALEAAGIAWWHIELPHGAVFFSANKARMLGRESEDFYHYNDFVKLVHPDDQEKAMQAMRDHLEGKADIYEAMYRIKAKDGTDKIFYDRGKIVAKKGDETTVAGVVFDVSVLDSPIQKLALGLIENKS
jgi:PAS domain S-box-containing protein